jgi:DNA-binding NtrC family response regulator
LPLAQHFLARFASRYGKPTPELSEDAARVLCVYRFPGNVRELRNIAERLVIRARGERVSLDLLRECGIVSETTRPSEVALPIDGLNLDDLERQYVIEALHRTEWNQSEASRLLGISVDRMNNRVKKYGLTNERWRVNKPGENSA